MCWKRGKLYMYGQRWCSSGCKSCVPPSWLELGYFCAFLELKWLKTKFDVPNWKEPCYMFWISCVSLCWTFYKKEWVCCRPKYTVFSYVHMVFMTCSSITHIMSLIICVSLSRCTRTGHNYTSASGKLDAHVILFFKMWLCAIRLKTDHPGNWLHVE